MNKQFNPSRLDQAFSKFVSGLSRINSNHKVDLELILSRLSNELFQGHSCMQLSDQEMELIRTSHLLDLSPSPLVLDGNKLYLQRYWNYENRLAKNIVRLLHSSDEHLIINETDTIEQIVRSALNQPLTIITGGPGTGKTTLVINIIKALLKANPSLIIGLAAPTGKAAARLEHTVNNQVNPQQQSTPLQASTIHRLLKAKPPSTQFFYHSDNPLLHDVLIIDEASMIDLALMCKLTDALKKNAKLILLGDKDQLASVESGSVLADLTCFLKNNTIELTHSYRFQGHIKTLANHINAQSFEKAWHMFSQPSNQLCLVKNSPIKFAADKFAHYLDLIKNNHRTEDIFNQFNQFRVLCANRYGTLGTRILNEKLEEQLLHQFNIQRSGKWYNGKPIIITQNSLQNGLYNGDTGICILDQKNNNAEIWFQKTDGGLRKILPNKLPAHELAYAITVHKSQGSEFDECLCILPEEPNPVLSKELLYTAVTRAKKRFALYSNFPVFEYTLKNKINRNSGLAEKLQTLTGV